MEIAQLRSNLVGICHVKSMMLHALLRRLKSKMVEGTRDQTRHRTGMTVAMKRPRRSVGAHPSPMTGPDCARCLSLPDSSTITTWASSDGMVQQTPTEASRHKAERVSLLAISQPGVGALGHSIWSDRPQEIHWTRWLSGARPVPQRRCTRWETLPKPAEDPNSLLGFTRMKRGQHFLHAETYCDD